MPAPAFCAHPPSEADGAWWAAHRHLFAWNERRGVLEFTPGFPSPVTTTAADERPGAAGAGDPEATPGPSGMAKVADMAQAPSQETAPGDERTYGSDLREGFRTRRPATLDDIIGQRRVVADLKQAVLAARIRGEALDHVLLTGPPGLGKTSLARAVAAAMGARLHATSGPALADPSVLAVLLASLGARSMMFIDEIHALPRRVAEILYEAMEDGTLSLPVIEEGSKAGTLTLRLEPFTLIGASTDPDLLPAPLAARFGLQEELEPYAPEELAVIVSRAAERAELAIDGETAGILARASLGIPRRALRLLARLRDRCMARARHRAGHADAEHLLEELGITHDGLGPTHQRALGILAERGQPLGAARLAALLGVTRRTFRTTLEPELLRSGRAVPTPRGLRAAGGGGS